MSNESTQKDPSADDFVIDAEEDKRTEEYLIRRLGVEEACALLEEIHERICAGNDVTELVLERLGPEGAEATIAMLCRGSEEGMNMVNSLGLEKAEEIMARDIQRLARKISERR